LYHTSSYKKEVPEMKTVFIARIGMSLARVFGFTLLAIFAIAVGANVAIADCTGPYTRDFSLGDCTFVNTGRNPFFVLDPGYWLQLQGTEGRKLVEVTITVLPDTELVDGVTTRVVEERELKNGVLAEVSRNFFAICNETNSVVYFGEDVAIYDKDGNIISNEGAWRAGIDGARAGIIMPGTFLLGSRYFQEIAPGVAMDRGCNTKMNLTMVTPAGTFSECVKVRETTPLEPGAVSTKVYCPGIGLVKDSVLRLVDWSERPAP
jgi:hypothetical protein